jgi:Uma2 family endonuclease
MPAGAKIALAAAPRWGVRRQKVLFMPQTLTAPRSVADVQHIVLEDVSWETYERLLEDIGERPIRMTFDSGRLEIMAPLPTHERWKKRIARLIETMTLESRIPMEPAGSTTFRRKKLKKGLEPDECYYLQSIDAFRRTEAKDPSDYPPPDLAIEVDNFHRSIAREPIYLALGVPELWRFSEGRLTVLLREDDRKYHVHSNSAAFPFLPMPKFEEFLLRLENEEQTALLLEFREWTRTPGV